MKQDTVAMKEQSALDITTRSVVLPAILLIAVVGVFGGCSQSLENKTDGAHEISAKQSQRRERDAALQVSVSDEKALMRISSVLVPPISFDASARGARGQAATLDESLVRSLEQELDVQIVSWRELMAKDTKTSKGEQGALTQQIMGVEPERKSVLEAARRRGVDSVLFARVHEYADREGSAVGADELAHAFISFTLVASKGEQSVWEASYRFRDQTVIENLLKINDRLFQSDEGVPTKRHVGFKDGEELLLNGFREAARGVATARMKSFTDSAEPLVR